MTIMPEATKSHQQHFFLQKPALGNFGRNELAIVGAPCPIIRQLVQDIIKALPAYKIGFADTEDKEDEETGIPSSYVSFTHKIRYTQVVFAWQPNLMQQRTLLNEADLVLVNGNDFKAVNQVVVISDIKPLHKEMDRLTNVRLVLMDGEHAEFPGYLIEQMPAVKDVPVLAINNIHAIANFIEAFVLQSTPVLNGLVLSGGESCRMGMDKGSIKYHGVKTQREYVYELMRALCDEVYVSCNAAQQQIVETEGLPFITDSFTSLGPLSGILSAFRYNPDAAWLVVACDLPYLSGGTLKYLVEKRDILKMATAFINEGNNNWPEPSIAIWEPRSYAWLLQLLAQGYSSPRTALINADTAMLQTPDISELRNVNEYNDYITTYNNLHTS